MYSISTFAKLVGVTPSKLRRLHNQGIFVALVNQETGYRYYTQQHVEDFLAGKFNFQGNKSTK